MNEKQKMLHGKPYYASDKELILDREKARKLTRLYNSSLETDYAPRQELINELFAAAGQNVYIEPPFRCDYGFNITVGNDFYANFNCVILDCGQVTIGDKVLLGPGVHIYTVNHPLDYAERAEGLEVALPVSIGNHVWIGGGAIINPGVHIGDNSVIGSGSVVTKNIPSHVVAAGNPCKIIRALK